MTVFLPGEIHGQRSLAGYSPWSLRESEMTEQLTLSLSLLIHIHRHEVILAHISWQNTFQHQRFKSALEIKPFLQQN